MSTKNQGNIMLLNPEMPIKFTNIWRIFIRQIHVGCFQIFKMIIRTRYSPRSKILLLFNRKDLCIILSLFFSMYVCVFVDVRLSPPISFSLLIFVLFSYLDCLHSCLMSTFQFSGTTTIPIQQTCTRTHIRNNNIHIRY